MPLRRVPLACEETGLFCPGQDQVQEYIRHESPVLEGLINYLLTEYYKKETIKDMNNA